VAKVAVEVTGSGKTKGHVDNGGVHAPATDQTRSEFLTGD